MPERWRPNVTVAAVIERLRAGGEREFLLVEEHTPEGLRLNNPAGHLERGESPQQAVVREVLEEAARVFTPQHLIGVYLTRVAPSGAGDDVTYLRFAFGGNVGDADPTRKLDGGIVRTLWLTLAELHADRARHRSELVLRCIEDHCAGRALPLDTVFTSSSVLDPFRNVPDRGAAS
jgi:8-oxo-dGTP pyrophosphatase MutT (NUDIX family)